MSQRELDRLTLIQKVIKKELSQVDAAKQLGLTTRHLRNLKARYLQDKALGLISKRRGKPSNNQLCPQLKTQATALIKAHYADFGPTFAHEKLTEQHGLKLCVESTRKLMIELSLWRGKKRKTSPIHQSRERRARVGELIQIDGSPHDWFEGRAPACCLLVYVDDATSRLMQLYFTASETLEAYFRATESYIRQQGRPLSFYSDKHAIFRVNAQESASGTGETQFGRALRELDIELICAHSPQAKGRVEKANRTLQDRLIKEMRLRGISDIASANAFLPEFIKDYNQRFAVLPKNEVDAHRLNLPTDNLMELIFSQQHLRKLSKNLEISYLNVLYQIQTNSPSYTLRGATITVCDKKGTITLLYKSKPLSYKTLNKNNQPAKILSRKELSLPKPNKVSPPKLSHPWRQYEQTEQIKKRQAT